MVQLPALFVVKSTLRISWSGNDGMQSLSVVAGGWMPQKAGGQWDRHSTDTLWNQAIYCLVENKPHLLGSGVGGWVGGWVRGQKPLTSASSFGHS